MRKLTRWMLLFGCLVYSVTKIRAGEPVAITSPDPFCLPLSVKSIEDLIETWSLFRKAESFDSAAQKWLTAKKRADVGSNAYLTMDTTRIQRPEPKITIEFDVPLLLASKVPEHRGFAALIQGCMSRFRQTAAKFNALPINEKQIKALIEVRTFFNFRDDPYNGHDCMWVTITSVNELSNIHGTWYAWLDFGNPLFEPVILPSSKVSVERCIEEVHEYDIRDEFNGLIFFQSGEFPSLKPSPTLKKKKPTKVPKGK